eukprot:1670590-Rhodomonas_salina.1
MYLRYSPSVVVPMHRSSPRACTPSATPQRQRLGSIASTRGRNKDMTAATKVLVPGVSALSAFPQRQDLAFAQAQGWGSDQRGLEQVGSVHAAVARPPRTKHKVDLVDKQNQPAPNHPAR